MNLYGDGDKVARTEESSTEPKTIEKAHGFRRSVHRKRWADMSPIEKTGNILMAVVECTMVLVALLDIRRRPASEINGSKRIWAMTALVQPFGPIVYFIFGRKRDQVVTGPQALPA